MKSSDWQILHELYKTPNITKVANRLYVTQPSLTKRLQMIEDEFQIKIVNRTIKGVEFTKEGEILAEKAKQYMGFMQQVHKELRESKGDVKEFIVIGSAYTYSKYALTDILVEYSKNHPNIRFEVQNEQSNFLFRKACDGDVDVAFVKGDYEGPVVQKKIDENPGYILTKEPFSLDDLPNMEPIYYKTNDRSKELLESWWEQRFNFPPPMGINAGYVDVSWQLIDKGLGYTCCFLPENFENTYNLVLTPMHYMDGTPVIRNTWFVYKDLKKTPKKLKDFIQYIESNVTIAL